MTALESETKLKTRLEVVKEQYPDHIFRNGMPTPCPSDYGFCMEDYEYENYCKNLHLTCRDCWNVLAETENIKFKE